ncbi:hypothetical protein GGF31_007739 [Allomyces arbusculus]|nr:hypothetical protein GGF31_007739 [Allomyces arbusculus]
MKLKGLLSRLPTASSITGLHGPRGAAGGGTPAGSGSVDGGFTGFASTHTPAKPSGLSAHVRTTSASSAAAAGAVSDTDPAVLDMLLTTLSHEVRTALTNIVGSADMLTTASNLPPELKEPVATIVYSSQHLLRVIDNVRLLGNLDDSMIEVSVAPFCVSDLVKQFTAMLEPVAQEHNVPIQIRDDIGAKWFLGDARAVAIVVENLAEIMVRNVPPDMPENSTCTVVAAFQVEPVPDSATKAMQLTVRLAHNYSNTRTADRAKTVQELVEVGSALPHSLERKKGILTTDQIQMGVAKRLARLCHGSIMPFSEADPHAIVLEVTLVPGAPDAARKPAIATAAGDLMTDTSPNSPCMSPMIHRDMKPFARAVDASMSPAASRRGSALPGNAVAAAAAANLRRMSISTTTTFSSSSEATTPVPPRAPTTPANPPTEAPATVMSPTAQAAAAPAPAGVISFLRRNSITPTPPAAVPMVSPVLAAVQEKIQAQQQQQQAQQQAQQQQAQQQVVQHAQLLQQVQAAVAPVAAAPPAPVGELWICPPDHELVQPKSAAERALLVVEDDTINQRIIRALLKKLGYSNIVFASDGADALFHYNDLREQNKYFDVILLDQSLPTLSGDDMCLRIRKLDRTQVIISCSANTHLVQDPELCRALGYDEAIAKPLYLDALRDVLDRWTVAGDARRLRHIKRRLKRDALAAGKLVTPFSFSATPGSAAGVPSPDAGKVVGDGDSVTGSGGLKRAGGAFETPPVGSDAETAGAAAQETFSDAREGPEAAGRS